MHTKSSYEFLVNFLGYTQLNLFNLLINLLGFSHLNFCLFLYEERFASIFSAIKNNSSKLSLAQTLYTLVKSNPLKCFSSARVKMSLLKVQISFPSNFVSILNAIKHNSSLLSRLKHYIVWSMAVH